MCRPGTRTGSRCLAAPAPPLRSTQGVCSDPSESRGWVFIREHVRRRTNTDPIAPFLEPSWELWTEGHWLPVAPSNREPLHCLSVLRVCVCLVFKRWESFTILNQGCLSRAKNRKELSGRRSRPQVLLEKSRYQGNHWIHLSFTRFEKKLADLSMHH